MADTGLNVIWSLEKSCLLRFGNNWEKPTQAIRQLQSFHLYFSALAEKRIFEDVCIVGWGLEEDDCDFVYMPESGFCVSDAFVRYGGLEKIQNLCGNCEANIGKEPQSLAGCCGRIPVDPWDQGLDSALQKIVQEEDLKSQFEQTFKITTPIWFGLWIHSPFNKKQLKLLQIIFSQLLQSKQGYDIEITTELESFASATEQALKYDLLLHSFLNNGI